MNLENYQRNIQKYLDIPQSFNHLGKMLKSVRNILDFPLKHMVMKWNITYEKNYCHIGFLAQHVIVIFYFHFCVSSCLSCALSRMNLAPGLGRMPLSRPPLLWPLFCFHPSFQSLLSFTMQFYTKFQDWRCVL